MDFKPNAVVEGDFGYHYEHFYKLTHLEIEQEASKIRDIVNGKFRTFKLAGFSGFRDLPFFRGEQLRSNIDAVIWSSISYCKGEMYPENIPFIIERPRSIVMNDGRIYVHEDWENEGYLRTLEEIIVPKANKIFERKKFEGSVGRFSRSLQEQLR